MNAYRVPLVPLVTIRATYDCTYWPEECGRCGAEVETIAPCEDAPDGYVCRGECGALPAHEVSPASDPARWGGWCEPSNPWGSLWGDDGCRPDDDGEAYGRGEPIALVLPIAEAAEFLADFPGAVWDLCEGESSPNYRAGVDVSVTAHVDGPGAVAALTLAGAILAGRR